MFGGDQGDISRKSIAVEAFVNVLLVHVCLCVCVCVGGGGGVVVRESIWLGLS